MSKLSVYGTPSFYLIDCLAERSEREARHLEMLPAERNPDDGDAQQNAEEEVRQGNPDSPDENPKDVHEDA